MKKHPLIFDLELIQKFYRKLPGKIAAANEMLARPMTLAEKLLYVHVHADQKPGRYVRGKDFINFSPDRVAMQDATAQMALLQFSTCGRDKVAVPTTVHCDHLIQAKHGAVSDLATAVDLNREVYAFLGAMSQKYGIGFYKPGAGLIHQVVLENYATPGFMMIGTDSHTPNAGGLGTIAIGVGGADAVDVMAGLPWELKMPTLIGIKLTGKLNGWTSAKDIILTVAGKLGTKGATDAIIEYFGEGAESLSATGKATICNMGAEVGATCSIFGYDKKMAEYLRGTNRAEVAECADDVQECLRSDAEVHENPADYYDQFIEINLDELVPHVNGPFTPGRTTLIADMAEAVQTNNWPDKVEVVLIGSCTNSSYEDITRAASIVRFAKENGLKLNSELVITPGSEMVRSTLERDGVLDIFEKFGCTVLANACGPCIGQWKRHIDDENRPNTIVTSFNRNFPKRNDGLSSTHAFVVSPEVAVAYAIAGQLSFNPLLDTLRNSIGEQVLLGEPTGFEMPPHGFNFENSGYIAPMEDGTAMEIVVDTESPRLQLLEPFPAWDGKEQVLLHVLIKTQGPCTTDHISMAGAWLNYRGHLDNISNNMLIGAINAFNGKTNWVKNQITGEYAEVPTVQRYYKSKGYSSIVVGEENYGEGSSREHAAMEPRFLGVKVILVKSFARIHETNLKKQGMLAVTFADKNDYDKIKEDDELLIHNLDKFAPGVPFHISLMHANGSDETITVNHTYNEQQIEWFKAGGALNVIRASVKGAEVLA